MVLNNMSNHPLSSFLRDLASDLESGKINPSQLEKISQFHITYQYGEFDHSEDDNESMKYVMLGWYIYNFLLKQ